MARRPQLIDVGEEHQAVEDRDAEHGDHPDRRAQIEVKAPQPQRRDPAHQRERHVEHHHQRLPDHAEPGVQETSDEEQDRRQDHGQPPSRALLVLELAAVGDIVAWRQGHAGPDGLPHIRREAAQVPSSNVGLHQNKPLAALVVNDFRPLDRANAGELRQRHGAARRGAEQNLAHRLGGRAVGSVEPHHNRVPPPPGDHL